MQFYHPFVFVFSLLFSLLWIDVAHATTYYISPSGSDSQPGLSVEQPWRSFDRAWDDLYPGDTLVLLDGTYRETLNPNERNGTAGAPITVRAQNDGMAIIDGEGRRETVKLESWENGPVGSYFVIEGIVAQNSSGSVYQINFDNNVLRRVSGYNAYTDGNEHVFTITANNTLLEDCVAAGSGRKMIVIFHGSNNVVRRCFANWQSWDGRQWHDAWPWGDNIQIYNASNNIIENSIAYGPAPVWSLSIQANSDGAESSGNQILGSMAIHAGMNNNGTIVDWGRTRPQPTEHTEVRDFTWPNQRVGIMLLSAGTLKDNLLQDVVSWGNAGLGLSTLIYGTTTSNNRVVRASVFNNGLDNPQNYGGRGAEVDPAELNRLLLEDTYIENTAAHQGSGAIIADRYVDGVLTNEPLWPWPMEERIQREIGVSINAIANEVLAEQSHPEPTSTSLPTLPAPTPTQPAPTSTPFSLPTATNRPTSVPPTFTPTPLVPSTATPVPTVPAATSTPPTNQPTPLSTATTQLATATTFPIATSAAATPLPFPTSAPTSINSLTATRTPTVKATTAGTATVRPSPTLLVLTPTPTNPLPTSTLPPSTLPPGTLPPSALLTSTVVPTAGATSTPRPLPYSSSPYRVGRRIYVPFIFR